MLSLILRLYPCSSKSAASSIVKSAFSFFVLKELNKFQAVLTTGMNKDTNVVENYILFLYGSNKVASAQGYVSVS